MHTKKIIIYVLCFLIIVSLVFLVIRLKEDTILEKQSTDDLQEHGLQESNVVVLETTKGNIEIELYPDKAPITVANFKEYVNSGHYDGLVFHRVISGFMIQGGGFMPDGTQRQTNPSIVLESENGLSNDIGTIAMARTLEPDSATSQFFINTEDNIGLNYSQGNPGYAVFGKVIAGMDVVYDIESTETISKAQHQNWPKEDIIIVKAHIK